MATFQHILVPTDFSSAASKALELALELAPKFDAKVTLLHVYYLPPPPYGDQLAWPESGLRQAAQAALDGALADAKARYPHIDGRLAFGDARWHIIDVAQAIGAGLIVMGTQGRKGFSHAFLGSVTERVVRTSPVPVLTVSEAGVSGGK